MLHPWYSALSPTLPYDVAVLELKTAAIATPAVRPALIARKHTAGGEHIPAGSLGTVAEWLGSESRRKSFVQLPYINFSACADLVHERHTIVPSTDKFCAGVKYAMRTLCRQDIGTGYVYRHPISNESYLRGVLSSELRPAQFTETCHQNDVAGFTNIADPLTLNWLSHITPVPCPAVTTSHSVSFVYCHLLGVIVDCTQPMPTGSMSVSVCNTGYHIDSNRTSKTSTCSSDGTWTDSHLTCVQVNPCLPSPCGPSSQCVEANGRADCACQPTFLGSPPNCRPECDVSADCGPTKYCANNTCHDVCVDACAVNASCTVVDHQPQCSCQPGYTGDARASCTLIPVVTCPAVEKNAGLKSVTCVHGYQLVDCNETMAPGTLVVYTCSVGYVSRGSAQASAICLSDGAWSIKNVTCAPDDYQQLTGLVNLYKYHGILLSWQDAKSSCEAEGTHLLILNSDAEFTAMISLINNNNKEYAWVGLKESDTKQHDYSTVLGQPLSATGFTRWQSGEPNDSSLGDVAYIHPSYSGLADYPATSSYKWAYICELEV